VPLEVQVERNPETGAIARVIRPASENLNPLNDPLNNILDASESVDKSKYVTGGIITELEEQALMEIKNRPRQQSKREVEWIERLVKKYGDDYGRMMRDTKLNPYQQTEGDLRKRIARWKERNKT
jgi:nucleolar protein 16